MHLSLDSFYRSWWSKNLAVWSGKTILANNLSPRTFPDEGFAQEIENQKIFHFSLLPA